MPDGAKLVYDKEHRTIVAERTLAPGCCSAIYPCSHQQRSPYTICDVCQRAADTFASAKPL